MPLMKISIYREKTFEPGSRPSINTIKKWIDNGNVYGEVIAGHYYIDPSKIIPVNDLVAKVMMQ